MFIATQSPLPATVSDFWRMLWEHRSPIVVMVMERGVEKYWPVDRTKDYGDLSVEPTTERHSADYTYREFKLTHYIVSLLSVSMLYLYNLFVCVLVQVHNITLFSCYRARRLI